MEQELNQKRSNGKNKNTGFGVVQHQRCLLPPWIKLKLIHKFREQGYNSLKQWTNHVFRSLNSLSALLNASVNKLCWSDFTKAVSEFWKYELSAKWNLCEALVGKYELSAKIMEAKWAYVLVKKRSLDCHWKRFLLRTLHILILPKQLFNPCCALCTT